MRTTALALSLALLLAGCPAPLPSSAGSEPTTSQAERPSSITVEASGRFTFAGQPFANAELRLLNHLTDAALDPARVSGTLRTDAAGNYAFTLRGAAPGDFVRLLAVTEQGTLATAFFLGRDKMTSFSPDRQSGAYRLSTVVFENANLGSIEPKKSTAQEKFDALKARGIIDGMEESTFNTSLTEGMTRAQFAKIVALILGLEKDTETQNTSSFSDVEASDWAIGYIEAAKKTGLMSGDSDGKFNPSGKISKEEMSAVLVKVLGIYGKDGTLDQGGLDSAAKSNLSQEKLGEFYKEAIDKIQFPKSTESGTKEDKSVTLFGLKDKTEVVLGSNKGETKIVKNGQTLTLDASNAFTPSTSSSGGSSSSSSSSSGTAGPVTITIQ